MGTVDRSDDTSTLTLGKSDDFTEARDPFALFRQWLADAAASEPNDPEAMTLATVDENGLPDARMVLLKGVDERGFVFYTNAESAKGSQLAVQAKAALVFHWKSLRRQVRVRGLVEEVTKAEADTYYDSRPRGSRIGAWASEQSRPLDSRATLERRTAEYEQRFGEGAIPRPDYWRGFRIRPVQIEFWHDRPFRLHDRLVFRRSDTGSDEWKRLQLYP